MPKTKDKKVITSTLYNFDKSKHSVNTEVEKRGKNKNEFTKKFVDFEEYFEM